ncbi:mediator complex subunit MED14-domain-containing protein [Dipodascopsis uninucleata]
MSAQEAQTDANNELKQVVQQKQEDGKKLLPAAFTYPPIPHISENFIPLSHVVTRLVENTYSELTNILETLPAANDMTKKRKFLNFLIHTRQQYIKLLVLTQWSRGAGELSRIIDVVSWLSGQKNCFSNVVWALQSVKKDLGNARLRNPDLATALEVFVLGRPRLSTFHYVRFEPLSPQKILSVLRELNVLLSLRLTPATNIPDRLRNYKIANGRATFIAAGEFEVDVSIADGSAQAQLFVVDFRFNFDPPAKVTTPIRTSIERVGNELLAARGLHGLYEYLHSFTISYKLLILHQQFNALVNGVWMGTLAVKYYVDRFTIFLQYWIEQTGSKTSVEIGVLKSKDLGVRWRPRNLPHMVFSIDQSTVSAESILSQVIVFHIQQLISSLYVQFLSSSISKTVPDLITPVSDTKLKLQLTPNMTTYLTIEHLTGRIVVEGGDKLIHAAEQSLNTQNHDVNAILNIIVNLRHSLLQNDIEAKLTSADWEVVKINNIKQEDLRKYFGVGSKQLSIFRRKEWISAWFVVAIIFGSPTKLLLTELRPIEGGWAVSWAESINVTESLDVLFSPENSEKLYRLVSAKLMFHVIADDLKKRGIGFKFVGTGDENPDSDTVIEFDSSLVTKSSWAKSMFRLEYIIPKQLGNKGAVRLSGDIDKQAVTTNAVATNSSDVIIDVQNGKFSLEVEVSPETQVLTTVLDRLSRIERMISFAKTVRSFNFELDEISLSRVSLYYLPGLKMIITFLDEQKMKLSLEPNTNPHRRIQYFLQFLLDSHGLMSVISLLPLTEPILKAGNNLDNGDVYFLAHSATDYRIMYKSKKHAIDVKLKTRVGKQLVYITDSSSQIPGFITSAACKSIWNASSPNVTGMDIGVACDLSALEETIQRVHKAINSEV